MLRGMHSSCVVHPSLGFHHKDFNLTFWILSNIKIHEIFHQWSFLYHKVF